MSYQNNFGSNTCIQFIHYTQFGAENYNVFFWGNSMYHAFVNRCSTLFSSLLAEVTWVCTKPQEQHSCVYFEGLIYQLTKYYGCTKKILLLSFFEEPLQRRATLDPLAGCPPDTCNHPWAIGYQISQRVTNMSWTQDLRVLLGPNDDVWTTRLPWWVIFGFSFLHIYMFSL